jgi:hypothetical protein
VERARSSVADSVEPVVGGGRYGFGVALRRDDLTAEQLERQRALDRSWAEAERAPAEPQSRAYLEESMRHIDAKEPALVLTRDQFLALTPVTDE